MANQISRRAVLAGLPAAALAVGAAPHAMAQTAAFSTFRLVRNRPGEPDRPQITFPDGYVVVPGDQHSVASRAEYYTFVTGPASDGIEVHVRWPGVPVQTVVHMNSRLEIRRDPDDEHAFSFVLPVRHSSPGSLQQTLQVWSHPTVIDGYYWRIEHNDPDRVAGPWTTVVWPSWQVRSVVHQLFAFDAIWRDSGLIETAAAKGHRWVLMGFETNNTLHPDNPPHWHMSYNSGPDFGSPTHNPHFWIDREGRNYYNGMDVTGLGRLRYYEGDPAPIYDFEGDANDGRGELAATITIREEDGGLDVDPPDGPRYSMAAGPEGDLLNAVTVLRDEQPWLEIETDDLVKHGTLRGTVRDLQDPAASQAIVHRYDRLTGVLR